MKTAPPELVNNSGNRISPRRWRAIERFMGRMRDLEIVETSREPEDIQHSTRNIEPPRKYAPHEFLLESWMFDIGCSTFSLAVHDPMRGRKQAETP